MSACSTKPPSLDAIIVATGPSLTICDCQKAASLPVHIYGVNDAYRILPRVDVLYACDKDWWDIHDTKTRHIKRRVTVNNDAAALYGLEHVSGRNGRNDGTLFASAGEVIYGGNSGFQALNLSYLDGFRNVGIIGFDMGGGHFFGRHPAPLRNDSPFKAWIDHFNRAAPVIERLGMRVVNLTRGGALECFPRANLDTIDDL